MKYSPVFLFGAINNITKTNIIDIIKDESNIESKVELDDMLSSLTKEELNIIRERYFNDKSQSEVSELTGYSQAKVSRYEKKILCKLRSYNRAS